MLTDTGPILAILDRGDQYHRLCMAAADAIRGPMITTWPCFGEAMYMLGREGGYHLQQSLWNLRRSGSLVVYDLTEPEVDRAEALMAKYHDLPMDLGDASIVAMAEARGLRQVFTIDQDFFRYRLADGSALEPIPGR